MNVTFFVGNGFDINLGLRTRYSDVYKEYLKEPSSSDTINKFKKDLCANYENWADFEMGMADYASRELNEEELIECVRDFRNFLIDYMENEQQKLLDLFSDEELLEIYRDEINRSYRNFYNGLIPNESIRIKSILDNPNKPITRYNTISLNYTTILDFFIKEISNYNYNEYIKYEPVLHPHGEGADGIALGIDNDSQIKIKLSKKGRRTFVKPFFNLQYDSRRIDRAENTIMNSDIICVFGLSLGDSDQMWRDTLAKWLKENSNGRIIWYAYEIGNINLKNKDEILDEEERLKYIFLKKLGLDDHFEEYEHQIFIPIEKSVFNFPTIEEILYIRLSKSKELVAK